MTLKKYTALLAVAIMGLSFIGCTQIKQTTPYLERQAAEYAGVISTNASHTTPPVQTTTTVTTTMLKGPEFTQVSLETVPVYIQSTELVYQAEDQELTAAFQAYNSKKDYTGSGYVSGLQGELQNNFVFRTEAPSSQHYDITVIVCAESGGEFTLSLNDTELETLVVEAGEFFTSITLPGIYMESGVNTVSVKQLSGDMYLDCLELRNNTSLTPQKEIEAVPCNKKASSEAKKLLSFLTESYGKTIISGQHVSSTDNEEIERIVKTTGKYPVMRFADLYFTSANGGQPDNTDTILACAEWSETGGITGLMQHWYAPMGESECLTQDGGFSLEKAHTDTEVWDASSAEIDTMVKAGAISEECAAIVHDIDNTAVQLRLLCDKNIPVLWRPLHGAGSGLYWWDQSGDECYLWLWELMYKRLTDYHNLNNLLWVWSGTEALFLPDSSMYDIVSADIYLSEDEAMGSEYEAYYALQALAEGKLIALSETGKLPGLSEAFRDGSVWSYFGLWYEPYFESTDNGFVTAEELIAVYNSESVMTLDEYKNGGTSLETEEETEPQQ